MADEHVQTGSLVRVGALQRALAVCAAMLMAVATAASGQTPTVDTSRLAAAAQALNQGEFDRVDALLRTTTDERSAVLRARSAIARGRYGEAEGLLAGLVTSSPSGDAALELGQLYLYLGRRQEGGRLLQTILARGNASSPAQRPSAGSGGACAGPLSGRQRLSEECQRDGAR